MAWTAPWTSESVPLAVISLRLEGGAEVDAVSSGGPSRLLRGGGQAAMFERQQRKGEHPMEGKPHPVGPARVAAPTGAQLHLAPSTCTQRLPWPPPRPSSQDVSSCWARSVFIPKQERGLASSGRLHSVTRGRQRAVERLEGCRFCSTASNVLGTESSLSFILVGPWAPSAPQGLCARSHGLLRPLC